MEPTVDDEQRPAFELAVLANLQPDLALEPDDGLVTFMALKDQDMDLAKRACEELYHRHARFLLGWCLNNRAETFGKDAKDLVDATFLKAFDKATTFQCPAGVGDDIRRRKVRRWLFRILYRAFLDARRSEQRETIIRSDDNEDGLLLEAPNPEVEANTSNVSATRKTLVWNFLETIEPLDQAILKVTMEYWSSSTRKAVLPPDVRNALCREFHLTENSLAVRRFRALKNLKQFILDHEKQQTTEA